MVNVIDILVSVMFCYRQTTEIHCFLETSVRLSSSNQFSLNKFNANKSAECTECAISWFQPNCVGSLPLTQNVNLVVKTLSIGIVNVCETVKSPLWRKYWFLTKFNKICRFKLQNSHFFCCLAVNQRDLSAQLQRMLNCYCRLRQSINK